MFLSERRGFCVQFATAYAVMARTLGIPTRVAVGFTPGESVGDGTYVVSSHDAHAWPEIWLAGIGWTHMFDPTPPAGTALGVGGGSDVPEEPEPATPPAVVEPVPDHHAAAAERRAHRHRRAGHRRRPPPSPPRPRRWSPPTSSSRGTSPWLPVLVVLLAVAVVAAGYAARGHHRQGATADAAGAPVRPPTRSRGAWEEALDELRERARADRSDAHAARARAASSPRVHRGATRPLRDVARRYTRARYGDESPSPDDATRAWESVDELRDALGADLGWRERWRRRLDPSSLRAARARRSIRPRR